jgi:hypothetical protein
LYCVPTDWLQFAAETGSRVAPAADEGVVREDEEALGLRFSRSLRGLYAQTNGLHDEWGYAYVLPVAELKELNLEFRSRYSDVYMPFDALVIFGQQGFGDLFFQPAVPEGDNHVFIWDHDDDSRQWYAESVQDALRRFAKSEAPLLHSRVTSDPGRPRTGVSQCALSDSRRARITPR